MDRTAVVNFAIKCLVREQQVQKFDMCIEKFRGGHIRFTCKASSSSSSFVSSVSWLRYVGVTKGNAHSLTISTPDTPKLMYEENYMETGLNEFRTQDVIGHLSAHIRFIL